MTNPPEHSHPSAEEQAEMPQQDANSDAELVVGARLDQEKVDEPTEIKNRLRTAAELFQAELAKWQEVQPCLEKRPDIKKFISSDSRFLEIGRLLEELMGCANKDKDSFWTNLSDGFSGNYFHDLFFIETLLTQYNSNDPNWRQIAEVVQSMAKIIKDLLAYVGAKIDECKIFSQIPSEGAEKLEGLFIPYKATKIPEIKSTIRDHAKTGDTGFVIAYRHVGGFYKNNRWGITTAWRYNPSDWG